jgi:hypothetical protein
VIHTDQGFIRAIIDASREPPVVTKRLWFDPPDFVETAGLSHQVTPDGRLIYVRPEPRVPGRYLRVVPTWVAQMKRAVDEANR